MIHRLAIRGFVMHTHSRAALFLLVASLAAPFPASAIGDVTCETPELAGVVAVVPLTADPGDDVALSKVADSTALGVVRAEQPPGGGIVHIEECIVGPLPPQVSLQSAPGGTPTQAYVEHGLSENASWRGFRFELALPSSGIPDGGSLTLVAVDFDTVAGLGDQYRVAVQRSGSTTELVLLRADGAAQAAARLPLGAGEVALAWGDGGLTLAHAGASASAALAPGSRARAVRLGYLGVDPPQAQATEVYVVDPAFTSE
jgi:hypothetical protein